MALYPNGTRTQPAIGGAYGDPRPGGRKHAGVDFIGFNDVHAIMGGKVTFTGWLNDQAGHSVAVDVANENGVVTTIVYMHLATIRVNKGQTIGEGAFIGTMGSSGNATGKCVHVEIRFWRGSQMTTTDPIPWLRERVGATPVPSSTSKPAAKPATKNNVRAPLKWRWTGIQRMLKGTGRYKGKIDNIAGKGSVTGLQDFLNDFGYAQRAGVGVLVLDGDFYTKTCKAMQQWLKEKWGYTGAIDADPGPLTKAAWDRAEAANGRAYAGVR